MTHFFATVLPGLEYVLEDEIRVKIADAQLEKIERGKVYFSSGLSANVLKSLRTADNLYRLLHQFRVGPHKIHLNQIEKELSGLDLSWLRPDRTSSVRCLVNASRTGKHTYTRFEAADAATLGVTKRDSRYLQGIAGHHDMEFRLDIVHEEAVFSLRLTDAAFRYRKETRSFTLAALRPTVAHALVWLSKPEASDVFIDPCCGSGTIPSERLAYPYSQIIGGDLSEEAVEAAQENAGSHDHVKFCRWDARRLPLDAGYADKIVTNLPFGRQIAGNEDLSKLYADILIEMGRVLKKNGSVLCLTEADDPLEQAAERYAFTCTKEAVVSLKGLHPTIFLLKKQ